MFIKNSTSFGTFLIFILSFCLYFTIGYYIMDGSLLVYHSNYICDLYFGFDNAFHSSSFVRHPLLKLISELLNFCFSNSNPRVISFFLIGVCSLLLSLQNVFIFKILNNIIKLSQQVSIWLSLCFALFGGQLLLSFTFDSYVFSSCFLTIFFYYFLRSENNNQFLKASFWFLGSLLVGGITISNFGKIAIVSLYSRFRIIYLKWVLLMTGIIIGFYALFYDKVIASLAFINTHTQQKGNFVRNALDYFFGSSFLIPNIQVAKINYINGEPINAIIGSYHQCFNYLLLLLLLITFLVIIGFNYKNRIIQVLVLSYSIDVFIHVIYGLGLVEAYIFNGNYNFIWPIIIGVGFKNISNVKNRIYYVLFFSLIFSYFFIKNLESLEIIKQFGLIFYPS